MDITLRQLEIFHAVVVAASVSRGARRVGLSQPTVSQQLAKMENTLGTQLLARRAAELELTPAGEYWFRRASDILNEINSAQAYHEQNFTTDHTSLRFGTTPSLRGRFLGVAAEVALKECGFARFDFEWAASSKEVVEQIVTHQLNCAVVSQASFERYRSTLSATQLFTDKIVWAVPYAVPEDVLMETLVTHQRPAARYDALTRFVNVSASVPWYPATEQWYRTHLPFAMPSLGCATHHAAIEFVAAGLATAHCPMSLLASLPNSVMKRLRFYELDDIARVAVLIMPKHLLSLRPFEIFRQRLIEFALEEYGSDALAGAVSAAPMPLRTEPDLDVQAQRA